MAANDGKRDLMSAEQLIQLLPELDILDSRPATAVFSPPSVSLPSRKPFRAALSDVLAVRDDLNPRSASQPLQSFDNCLQLHLIVRRQWQTATELTFGAR